MKHIRIQIDAKKSYLVYQRGLIMEFAEIVPDYAPYASRHAGLTKALRKLREYIGFERNAMRKADKLADRPIENVLRLLAEKRKKFARQCFSSKKPLNLRKHVGVEIEFLCRSNRDAIARDLATLNLAQFVELKSDGSVKGESNSDDCDGSCREDCDCANCGETHYCDDERECTRRERSYGAGETWEIREDCQDCTETETIEDCDCGGLDLLGEKVCKGEHIICDGHCPGHSCMGYDDHDNYDCNCECTCGDGQSGHEIAIVASSKQISDVVTKVCKVLADHDAEVNKTCGLHVHIDARGQDEKRMFSNLVKSQKLLYSMCPKSRYLNTYCAPNTQGLEMSDYSGRYWGVNPASYGEHETIEIRLHSGTVSATKIINWIELLQAIAYAKSVKEVKKLGDLTSKVKITPKLLEYIKIRVNEFRGQHGSYSIDLDDTQRLELEDSELIAA